MDNEATKAANTEPRLRHEFVGMMFAIAIGDLRHTAVSRMFNARVPIAQIARIVGWSPATMVRMAARYGHFSLDELRGAVESISTPPTEDFDAGSLQFPLQSETDPKSGRTN